MATSIGNSESLLRTLRSLHRHSQKHINPGEKHTFAAVQIDVMASGEARRSKAAEAAKVLEPDKKLTQEQRLRLFIRVGIQGNAEAHKQIPRIKMTKVNLDRVFEMDVAFLQEESSGAALWPPQWKELC